MSTAAADAPAPAAQPRRSLLKRCLLGFELLIVAAVAYLLLWPAPIDPVAYEPPEIPQLVGVLQPNDRLASATLIAQGKIIGPEDVELDSAGNIFTGLLNGTIVRIDPQGDIKPITNTGGRPVGLSFAPSGQLIVADAVKGLLSIDPADGATKLLTDRVGDEPLGFADDVTVASDGRVYFSDASTRFHHDEYLYDMLEARPHGRLARYDPSTQKTESLLPELYFANGVALSQNEDFVLVVETYRFRIMRYWLAGEKAGTAEVFIENLPGYPDNITSNRQGAFWLALFTVRNETADQLAPQPFLKSMLSKLPAFLWPKPQPYAFVVKLDESGHILESLQDPTGQHLQAITSAIEHDGNLYLGSLSNDRIGKYKLQ